MPAAAKPKNAKPKTPAEAIESLRDLNNDLRAESAADWRRWAIALADGQGVPGGRELLATAAALKIHDPANDLQADADAILEVRFAVRRTEECERAADELLAPFDGKLENITAAIEAAKAEVERLKAIYTDGAERCGASHYRSTAHRVRVKHPRVWPTYYETGTKEDP